MTEHSHPDPGRAAWQWLVKRYAGKRKVCNCGDAWSEENRCPYGCAANQLAAKGEIARRVMKELPE